MSGDTIDVNVAPKLPAKNMTSVTIASIVLYSSKQRSGRSKNTTTITAGKNPSENHTTAKIAASTRSLSLGKAAESSALTIATALG
jgi:hypothetical protein